MTQHRSIYVAIDETPYPCVVALGDGSQPMADPQLGWTGNPIPRWNGFVAYPLFDRETVNAIKAECESWARYGDESDQLSWDGDTVVITNKVYAADDPAYQPERVEPEIVDGVTRWAVGACSWAWSEVDDPEETAAHERDIAERHAAYHADDEAVRAMFDLDDDEPTPTEYIGA